MSFLYGAGVGSAIPDSEADNKLIHRWYLSEDSAPFVDQIGAADSTDTVGTTQVTGSWVDEAARDGDGADDVIETTTLGPFGSNLDTNHAIAFSIQTSADNHRPLSVQNDSALGIFVGVGTGPAASGTVEYGYADTEADFITVSGSSTVNDGSEYRIVLNKTGNTASGLEIWRNQTEESVTIENDQGDGITGTEDLQYPLPFFARNNQGTLDAFFDGVIDDICIFDDSLTQSEIQSYQNPWE